MIVGPSKKLFLLAKLIKNTPLFVKKFFGPKTPEGKFILNKGGIDIISTMYLVKSKDVLHIIPDELKPYEIIPGVTYAGAMAAKYFEVGDLGPSMEIAFFLFVNYKGYTQIGYIYDVYNNEKETVKIAKEEWMWPKKFGKIKWRNDKGPHTVELKDKSNIVAKLTATPSNRIKKDILGLPGLTHCQNKFWVSTVYLDHIFSDAEVELVIPEESPLARFPVSPYIVDSFLSHKFTMTFTMGDRTL